MKKKHAIITLSGFLGLVLAYILLKPGSEKLAGAIGGAMPPPILILDIPDIQSGYPDIPEDSSQVLAYTGFHLSYNEEFEQANWSAYILTSEMIRTGTVERSNDFRTDTNVITQSATTADYRGSGYDRGHLAPAGDMKWDKRAMSTSFLMSNMSPQAPQFNRQIWRLLEAQVRRWAAENDSLFVITGPVLHEIDSFIGPNHVGVPRYYFKLVLDISSPTYKGIAFLMENKKLGGGFMNYAITIDSLERFLGYDFFPQQDPESMKWIESHLDPGDW